LDTARIEAAGGFGYGDRADELALGHTRQYLLLLIFRTAFDQQGHSQQRAGEEWSWNQGLAGFLDDYGHVEEATALAAVVFRNQQPGPSEFDDFFPEALIVGTCVGHHLADKFGLTIVGQKALGRVAQHLLLFRKSEVQLLVLRREWMESGA
jgi:hypothetical protein